MFNAVLTTVATTGSRPLTPQRDIGNWEFPTDGMALCWGEVYSKSVSQSFLSVSMGIFSHSLDV